MPEFKLISTKREGRNKDQRDDMNCSSPPEHAHFEFTAEGKSTSKGKRFARRAKRWAELQSRRCLQNPLVFTQHYQAATQICDYVEFATIGSGIIEEEITPHAPLTARRSFPYSIIQPRSIHYSKPLEHLGTIYNNEAANEYGQCTRVSLYQSGPEITVYSRKPQPLRACLSYPNNRSRSCSFNTDDVSSLTADLSSASICSASSSPLSTSVSSNDPDDCLFFDENRTAGVNTAPPPDRNWVMVRQCDPERPIATFTVLCYNVLCDKYATVNQYSYCPSWALNWEYRKVNIMKEIRNYEADIITLQEVEMDQFRTMFQPELKGLGYTGIFSPKSRARTMSEEDRKFVDGCAIFWKSDKFDLDREHVIEFTSLVTKKASSSQHMLNRVMPRDNIALCAVLKIKDNVYQSRGRIGMSANDNVVGSPLVVCTAHIHWDPEFCDVKLVQTMMLAHEMHKIIEDVAVHYNISSQQTPVLICGDLNSLPDSGVYEYLSRGHIARNHPDLKDFRNDQSLDTFVYSSDGDQLTHALKLESAVDTNITPFTNYTLDFKGMIDYIFSTPQSLARLGVLGSIEQTWVNQNKIIGFPHPHVPSDHIPIMAQYAIIPPSHQRQVNNLPPVTSSSTTSQLGPNGSLTPTFSR